LDVPWRILRAAAQSMRPSSFISSADVTPQMGEEAPCPFCGAHEG
jgi:hypothetical protein